MFKFKPEKKNFQKTEQQIAQSIMDNEPFLLQKKQKTTMLSQNPKQ